MAVNAANLAGSEPIDPIGAERGAYAETHPRQFTAAQRLKPSFSEYRYWANLKRQSERDGTSGNGVDANGNEYERPNIFKLIKNGGRIAPRPTAADSHRKSPTLFLPDDASHAVDGEKKRDPNIDITVTTLRRGQEYDGLTEDEAERLTAQRALRIAGWTTITYLITTDILGPFNAPYAIANMGMVPGVCCYFFFGVIASISAYFIGFLYNRLDSDRYPIRTYGDICERLVGKPLRYFATILQSIQLIVNVGIICLSNGQSLYQVAKGNLCFSVCVLIMALAGMLIGQIRSLRNFGVIGQMSVFLNFLIIFVSLGVVCNTGPNYAVANAADSTLGDGPVVVQAFNSGSIEAQINGMFNIVFAYGGAMIFPEMISEMRRPMDFWKGMFVADTIITIAYMVYGIVWYTQQGQYTQAQSYFGLTPYWAQTFCNILAIITGLIAACLYGNIGVKVIYINVFQDMLGFPPLNTKKGRICWTVFIPVYWAIAFVIGSSVPALGAMTGLIGAVCIFQFTYTFPPLLMLCYHLKTDGGKEDEHFSGYGTKWTPSESWRSVARWTRAWFGGGMLSFGWKIVMLLYFLACLATVGMGMYGTGESVKSAFEVGQATSFGCKANA